MSEKSLLRYEITGGEAFAAVKIFLERQGQQVVAEGGAMIYMTGNVTTRRPAAPTPSRRPGCPWRG